MTEFTPVPDGSLRGAAVKVGGDLDAGALESFPPEQHDGAEAHEARLVDDVDLGVVASFEHEP